MLPGENVDYLGQLYKGQLRPTAGYQFRKRGVSERAQPFDAGPTAKSLA